MILKAKQTRFPFIFFKIIAILAVVWCLLNFFKKTDFSSDNFISSFTVLPFILGGIYLLNSGLKKSQSVELFEGGIRCLRWTRPSLKKMIPNLEPATLNWDEIKKIEINLHLIYLRFKDTTIVINTLLFEDGNEVVKFINLRTQRK